MLKHTGWHLLARWHDAWASFHRGRAVKHLKLREKFFHLLTGGSK